jgi:hypothetical protein
LPRLGQNAPSSGASTFSSYPNAAITSPATIAEMATKREFDTDDTASAKRLKMENGNGKLEPASNPYLAHWNDEPKMKSKATPLKNLARY